MSIEFVYATEADNGRIHDLIRRTPQRGIAELNFERKPDYFFGARVSTQSVMVILAIEKASQEVVGIYSLGDRWVYVNGVKQNIRYASDLRIALQYRKGQLLPLIFEEIKKLDKGGEYVQSVILADNAASLTAMLRKSPGGPTYHPYLSMNTYVISTLFDRVSSLNLEVRRATEHDVVRMQALFDVEAPKKQFYPVYDFARIGVDPYYRDLQVSDYFLGFLDGELVGIIGTWNQKGFKQTRVVDYAGWMAALRPFYNWWSCLFGGFPLPRKGHTVRYTGTHCLIIRDNDPVVFASILKAVRLDLRRKGEQTMIVGLCDNDPLRLAMDRFVHKIMRTNHYLGCYSGDPRVGLDKARPLYLDVARL